MAQRQAAAPAVRKGDRTRDRLKLAAVQALEQRGYHQLRVADICRKAKVSAAVFYLYFENKEEITAQVLAEFLDHTFRLSEAPAPKSTRTLFEALYEANLGWISAVRANAGLTRCLLQLSDQVPEFKELTSRTNHAWFVRVTRRLMQRFPAAKVDENTLLLAVYALGGMIDELCSKLLVSRDVHLAQLAAAAVPSDEALAEFVSVLWYRALLGRDPPRVRERATRDLLRFGTSTVS